MPQEAVQRHDQGPLSQTMRELEAKNAEVGGLLFSTVGKGKEKAFLFPTSVSRQEGGVTVDEFLVVTSRGSRAIQIEKKRHREGYRETIVYPQDISDYITARLDKKPGIFASDKYSPEQDSLRLSHNVFDRHGGIHIIMGDNVRVENCRLIQVDAVKVEEILNANMKRVEAIRATSQRISGVLGKVS